MFDLHCGICEHHIEFLTFGSLHNRLRLRRLGHNRRHELALTLGFLLLFLLAGTAENVASRRLLSGAAHHYKLLNEYGGHKPVVFLNMSDATIYLDYTSPAGRAEEPDLISYLCHNRYNF